MNICLKKMGMTQIRYEQKVLPVTLLWCEMLKVLDHKTKEKDGYSAMVMGFGNSRLKRWNKAQHYLFKNFENSASEKVYEFRSEDTVDVGSQILPSELFPIGSFVDISGNTIGRGFSGCMKRHNFCGLPASHGVSKAHRKPGSIGNLKVLISERMEVEGREGCLIGVYGAVPGANNSVCYLKPAVKKGKRA